MDDRVSFREFAYLEMMIWFARLKLAYMKLSVRCWEFRLWLLQNYGIGVQIIDTRRDQND